MDAPIFLHHHHLHNDVVEGVTESSSFEMGDTTASFEVEDGVSDNVVGATSANFSVIVQSDGGLFGFSENFSNVSSSDENERIGVDNEPVFIYMYILSVGGYIVNATLFATICCRQKFRRATNYLLANLCISSILFLMAVNLRIFERTHGPVWTYTSLNCVAWSILRRIPQALASLTIVAISCDRSQAARNLVTRPCSTDMTRKILRIWIIAILTTLPRGLLYRYTPDVETSVVVYKCAPVAVGPHGIFNFLYAFFHLVSIFMLPMCILICDIYSTVQKIVFLKSRQTPVNHPDNNHHLHHQDSSQNTQLHKKQLQLLRNSCLFAALFLVCWLPWGVYQNLGDLPKSIVSPEFRYTVLMHFKTMRYLPFTVTAFLPLLLVIATYDANTFSLLRKCLGMKERGTPGGENYRPNDAHQQTAPPITSAGRGRRMELAHNRPRSMIVYVNNVRNNDPV